MKKIIAIDFDGVIVEDCFPNIGAMKPGAKEYISKLYDYCTIIIWTSRGGLTLELARTWLEENEIPYHHLNNNSLDTIHKYGGDSRKVFADIYIDDRQLYGFPGWEKTYELVCSYFQRQHRNSI